jgi:hypothetical protein
MIGGACTSQQIAQIVFGVLIVEVNRYIDGIRTEEGLSISEEETVGITVQRLFYKESFTILEHRRFYEVGEYTVVSEEENKQLFATSWKDITIPIQLFLS